MPPFQARIMPVFDRAGIRIGKLTRWTVTGPRSYRINEIEDFHFFVPRNDGTTSIYTEPSQPPLIGSTGNAVGSSNSTISFTRPTGTQPGDRVIVLLGIETPTLTITPPNANWVLEGKVRAAGQGVQAWSWKVSDANPSAYQFTSSGDQAMAGGAVTYRNASRFAPMAAISSTGDKATVPTLQAPLHNEWVLAIAVGDRNTTWTVPNEFDALFGQSVGPISVRAAHMPLADAGATPPTKRFTATSSGENLCLGIIVQETASVEALLVRDNLIYIANDLTGMPGWAGAIAKIEHADGGTHVSVNGTLALFDRTQTTRIEQDEGLSHDIARRLVSAANAKQAASGDLVVEFEVRTSPPPRPNFGLYVYEGDILQGLTSLAQQSLAEFYMSSWIDANTGRLRTKMSWGAELTIDRAHVVLKDGPGGNVSPGTKVSFTGNDRITAARLIGAPTKLAEYLDYQSVSAVIKDIVPEAAFSLVPTEGPSTRRRESLDLSVNWGFSKAMQKDMAREVQRRYVNLYKTFLYAFHDRWGQPFLEGYDWSGADGSTARWLRMSQMRTVNVLGLIGDHTIITTPNPADDTDANVRTLVLKQTLDIAGSTGLANDFASPRWRWLADTVTGEVQHMHRAGTLSSDRRLKVANVAAGEALWGISTDEIEPHHVWALVRGSQSIVRRFDMATGVAQSSWQTPEGLTDIAVDVTRGLLYASHNDRTTISVRDLNSGVVLRTYESHTSGVVWGVGLTGQGSFIYTVSANGLLTTLHALDGGLAGTNQLPFQNIKGMFVDGPNSEIWVCLPNKIETYWATIAVATVNGQNPVDGAPAFDVVSGGQFTHIVMAKSRREVGYNVPPRPDFLPPEGEDPGDGGNDGDDPGNGGNYDQPDHNNRSVSGTNADYGLPGQGDTRQSPFKAGDLPILAVIHITNAVANHTDPPHGINAGQGTHDDITTTLQLGGAIHHSYVARNGAWSSVLDKSQYAGRGTPVLRAPRTSQLAINRIIHKKYSVRYRDEFGSNVVVQRDNCVRHSNGSLICHWQPGYFVYNQIAATASASAPMTDDQIETIAYIIATNALTLGLGIGRGTTVLAHSDFDSAGNRNCPFPPAQHEAKMNKIVKRARAIANILNRRGGNSGHHNGGNDDDDPGNGGNDDDGNTGGPPCFVAGTPVLTPAGAVPIEALRVGDLVMAVNEQGDVLVAEPVTAVIRHPQEVEPMLDVVLFDGRRITSTAGHLFFEPNSRQYRPLREFEVGDFVWTPNGLATIAQLNDAGTGPTDLYNLDVAEHHNYLVDGVLVHNVKTEED